MRKPEPQDGLSEHPQPDRKNRPQTSTGSLPVQPPVPRDSMSMKPNVKIGPLPHGAPWSSCEVSFESSCADASLDPRETSGPSPHGDVEEKQPGVYIHRHLSGDDATDNISSHQVGTLPLRALPPSAPHGVWLWVTEATLSSMRFTETKSWHEITGPIDS